MSEKLRIERNINSGRKDNMERAVALLEVINKSRREEGLPEYKMIAKRERPTSKKSEPKRQKSAEVRPIRKAEPKKQKVVDFSEETSPATKWEIEQERDEDNRRQEEERARIVQEVMAEDALAKKPTKLERVPTNDPDMQEIVLREAEASEPEEEPEEEAGEPTPSNSLVGVGVDWDRSEEKLARKLAREDLESEMEEAGIIKKIWKGKLFRNYYEEKYIDEYLENDRTDKDGRSLYDIIDNQKQELMEDIVSEVTEDVRRANKKEISKKLVPIDKETNEKIKSTIEDYARFMYEMSEFRPDIASDPNFIADVDTKFNREMNRFLRKAEKKSKFQWNIRSNNYLDVAKEATARYAYAVRNARDKVEQDAAMAKVMVGFQAYNVESRKKFSDEHRDNLDKLIHDLNTGKIGQFVPARIISTAVETITRDPEETRIINDIRNSGDLIGGEEGIRIMMDKTPSYNTSESSLARFENWWNGLSEEGRNRVRAIIGQIEAYPNRYGLTWGNGVHTWLAANDRGNLAA